LNHMIFEIFLQRSTISAVIIFTNVMMETLNKRVVIRLELPQPTLAGSVLSQNGFVGQRCPNCNIMSTMLISSPSTATIHQLLAIGVIKRQRGSLTLGSATGSSLDGVRLSGPGCRCPSRVPQCHWLLHYSHTFDFY
jgi:hypothetical protein